jgi:cytoplasmic iron level regulating protein YaaA (DUF328/UPF0246 family)
MRIIISPAKQMIRDPDATPAAALPVFLDRTEILMKWMQSLSFEAQRKLWACSDAIAEQNHRRLETMDLRRNLTPALLAFDGIQYQYMAPTVFESSQYDYVQAHLRILSGFYGVLKPMDGVTPYRLEMQAKAAVNGSRNLYDFWGSRLYQDVMDDSRVLINLASKEYSKSIAPYLQPGDRMITCVFGELQGGRVVQKGVYVKMARGEMVRFLAETKAETPEALKAFEVSGYCYDPEHSDETTYVFTRTAVPGKAGGR